MTEHNDLQHKLVNDVYAELGTISKHSQDVIDYLMRHGWIRTPAEAEAAARGEVSGRTITESELSRKLVNVPPYAHDAVWLRAVLYALGITVVPEPADVEKITHLILENSSDMDPKFIAEMLVENGVRPMRAGGDEPEDERDRAWWIDNANVDAEDCEACGVEQDLCPVHHGIALGIEFVTKKIAALGDDPELFNSIPNPPKAPGATDDH